MTKINLLINGQGVFIFSNNIYKSSVFYVYNEDKSDGDIIELFENEMKSEFKKNRADILAILEEKRTESSEMIKTSIYSMTIHINWEKTYTNFLEIKE
jgi:hypothetical protein